MPKHASAPPPSSGLARCTPRGARCRFGWNVLWFIVGVSLLVTVHEFGHFWVARKLGFKVLRFSVGFGKPLLKKIGARARPHRICHRRRAAGRLRAHAGRARRRGVHRRICRAPSPASRPGSASWCCWPDRPPTSCSPSCCSGACSGSTASPAVKPVVDKVTAGSPAATAGLRAGDEIRDDRRHADPRSARRHARVVRRDQRRRRSRASRCAARTAPSAA